MNAYLIDSDGQVFQIPDPNPSDGLDEMRARLKCRETGCHVLGVECEMWIDEELRVNEDGAPIAQPTNVTASHTMSSLLRSGMTVTGAAVFRCDSRFRLTSEGNMLASDKLAVEDRPTYVPVLKLSLVKGEKP